ncbi:Ferredoxin subunit of nitrite reductase or a ring-hydroxylating dioxygenase [Micromonospora purpureochromogenes]|uniref:Ferredoxin subunit of nitrite reductase or a ring-hydroxylating dioxygenase n=1 Tax=Micromonospora purpureochromogenes TaxID=47872 RepID=A0A1C4XBQ2_9ACTN|nr:Rieske (2Fe-2S) protein [Micromonospora purpureochromogenes]SCF05876.1 Ferredoxin subunit of nitrite reductase or a ring-hydroxylating dioxygenase [Micromonospora purpureochromogenes]
MSDDQVLTGPGTQTRRALLAGAGAVGASVLLTACGGDDSGAGTTAPTSGGPGATAGDAEGGDREGSSSLATTGDIPVGGGQVYAAQGVVITQPEPGQFKGFDPICTHQGCPVSNVDGGTINCTCHNSKYSITDGSVKQGPATKPLAPKTLKVQGDQISLA